MYFLDRLYYAYIVCLASAFSMSPTVPILSVIAFRLYIDFYITADLACSGPAHWSELSHSRYVVYRSLPKETRDSTPITIYFQLGVLPVHLNSPAESETTC